jgi:hypothetical protein
MSGKGPWFVVGDTCVAPVCLALLVALSCGSDEPGELPAPPCAGRNALVVGTIEDLGSGCVSVRVQRVVSEGDPIYATNGSVLFNGNPDRGAIVRGRLGSLYSWQHEFEDRAEVAFFVEPRGEELSLQLFPRDDDQVQVQWGSRELQLEVGDMVGPDCAENLEMRREASDDVIEDTSSSHQTSSSTTSLCTPR